MVVKNKKRLKFSILPPDNRLRGIPSCWQTYIVSERKLGFFVQIKEGENFNRRNTLSISRIKI